MKLSFKQIIALILTVFIAVSFCISSLFGCDGKSTHNGLKKQCLMRYYMHKKHKNRMAQYRRFNHHKRISNAKKMAWQVGHKKSATNKS